jgi:hypothetical protein
MKRRLCLLAMIAAILLSVSPVSADGDFYVIAGGGGAVGTKITSLPCTISAPGFYYLGANFTYTGVGPAITISDDGATLDLMGFRISGNGTNKGIYMSGRKNVEIRNGSLKNFTYGIQAELGFRHRIINVRVEGNNTYQSDSYGIKLNGSAHLVKGCSAWGSGCGIALGGGTVSGCHLEGCTVGIAIFTGNVIGNSVYLVDNQMGITGGNVMLDQNTVTNNGGVGITNYDIIGSAPAWGTNVGR